MELCKPFWRIPSYFQKATLRNISRLFLVALYLAWGWSQIISESWCHIFLSSYSFCPYIVPNLFCSKWLFHRLIKRRLSNLIREEKYWFSGISKTPLFLYRNLIQKTLKLNLAWKLMAIKKHGLYLSFTKKVPIISIINIYPQNLFKTAKLVK